MRYSIPIKIMAAASLLIVASSAFCQKLVNISPSGEAAYKQKLEAFQTFDEEKVKKAVEEIFPLFKEGDEVTINYINRNKTVTGKFFGLDGRSVKIDNGKVPIVDIDATMMNKLDAKKNEELRRSYIRKEKNKYNEEKLKFMQDLKKEIHDKYPALNAKAAKNLFLKITDKEKNAGISAEFKNAYDASLPVKDKDKVDEFLEDVIKNFTAKKPELVYEKGFIWLRDDWIEESRRLMEIEKKATARLEERIMCPKTATPTFEPDGGTFNPEKSIQILCSTEDAEIRYTLDGSEPTEDSPVYKEALALQSPASVKAKAYHPVFNDSDIGCISNWDGGLYGSYFSTMTFKGQTFTRIDPEIDFEWGGKSPHPSIPADLVSMIWTGTLTPKKTDTYTFYVTADDGAKLWLDNNLAIDAWHEQAPTEYEKGGIKLVAGEKYDVRLCLTEVTGLITIKLEWSSPSTPRDIIPQTCLSPEGKSTELLKKWNTAVKGKDGKDYYTYRDKMLNPAGTGYKLPLSAKRWLDLKLGD